MRSPRASDECYLMRDSTCDTLSQERQSSLSLLHFPEQTARTHNRIVMATKPKLTYLNMRGSAEPIRYLFAYADIEYEDRRIEFEDFAKEKLCLPYGQVPVLEINGKVINQSNAIARFVASLCGLTGSDNFEAFQIHAVADTILDFRNFFADAFWRPFEPDEEQVQARKQDHIVNDVIPFYLSRFEKTVKENKGYFVNGKLSYADILFAALCPLFSNCLEEDIMSNYPILKELVEKVNNIPRIKAWIEKRPITLY